MDESQQHVPEFVAGYDPSVRQVYLSAPRRYLEQQRLLYALVVRGVEIHVSGKRYGCMSIPLVAAVLFLILVVGSFLAIVVACFLLQWLPVWVADPLLWVLAALLIYALLAIRKPDGGEMINAFDNGLSYGRLQQVLSQDFLASMGLGMLFGMQVGLVSATRTHLGIPEDAAERSFSLCWSNFLQAIFSDVFELYGGKGFSHDFWSATSFFIFRTAYTALFVYGLYLVVRKFRTRRCFAGFPRDNPTMATVIDWLRDLSRVENAWMLDYFDEYLFLRITAEYLDGNFAAVRRLSASFPRLKVGDPVRDLFVDAAGERLFAGYRTG